MIICPFCQSQEVEGALFCGECGTFFDTLTTQNIQEDAPIRDTGENKGKILLDSALALQIVEDGYCFSLTGKDEYTIGRISEGQTILPDIDLTSFHAYEYGVSRLHAVIKKNNDKITVMDLHSSNGTYVNGARLLPEKEYPLNNGDILSFGKLKIQLLMGS